MDISANITSKAIHIPVSQPVNSTAGVLSSAVSAMVSGARAVSKEEVSALEHQNQEPVSLDTIKAAAATGNAWLQNANHNLQFQVDDATKQVVIRVVDSKTGELVRQIPTVEMLDFIRHMKELEGNAGAILSKKA